MATSYSIWPLRSDTPHSVGLLWTDDQCDTETSTWQHTILTRDTHPFPGEIRSHKTSKRAAAYPRLRPQGHRDRPVIIYRVSQEECARLREGFPYVKICRYNPKHLHPKLNGYGDNGQRKVGASCGSKYCNLHSWYVTWQCWRPWEGNAVFTVRAWRFAQSAMLRHRGVFSCIVLVTLRTTMTRVRVLLVQFNGFMSLTS